jgi:hypothetical protein
MAQASTSSCVRAPGHERIRVGPAGCIAKMPISMRARRHAALSQISLDAQSHALLQYLYILAVLSGRDNDSFAVKR